MTKKIMVADMPRMLRDFVANVLSHQPDVSVVGSPTEGSLIAALAAVQVDAVVVASSDPAALQAADLALARIASLSVLALSLDGRSACIHRIRSETQVLEEVTRKGSLLRWWARAGAGRRNTSLRSGRAKRSPGPRSARGAPSPASGEGKASSRRSAVLFSPPALLLMRNPCSDDLSATAVSVAATEAD